MRWTVNDKYCKAFPAYAAITADLKYVIRPHHRNPKQIQTVDGYAALDEADFTSFLLRFPGTREHVQLVGGWQIQHPGLSEWSSWERFFFFLSKLKPRKVGAIMRVVKPARWGAEYSRRAGANARVPLGAWWAGSPWPLKRLPWQCKEQVYPEGLGRDRPSSPLPILQRSLTSFINNLMMNHFNWAFIAVA